MKVLLGISGSIAAYKAATLVRLLRRRGDDVQVVITPAGKEFITPATLAALSGRGVVSEFFEHADGTWHSHVDLGRWADVMLIAPATASTLGKMASGVADNMLITTYLAMKAPVVVAPAMDLDMYAHPATQANIQTLRSRGVHIIEPVSGPLASGLVGKGRFPEPEEVVAQLDAFLLSRQPKSESAKRVLITAGPTHEPIDEVRYIANHSTGKMGFALAEACAERGMEVTLIAGPVSVQIDPATRSAERIHRIDVTTAAEMYAAATEAFPHCDAAILCAAVADFTPEVVVHGKMKRGKEDLPLRLVPTRDIAAALGAAKRPDQRLIAFALEAEHEHENALNKLQRKHADAIVLNSLRDEGAGFACDTNKITLITAQGQETAFPLKAKSEVARDIVDFLLQLCNS